MIHKKLNMIVVFFIQCNMKNAILFFKGILIGIGKIVPGVSGSVLAILLGLYDRGLEALQNIFKKENFLFLSISGSGILLSIVYGSSLILYFLKNNYFPTMLLFCGLILGTVSVIKKEVKLNSHSKKIYFTCLTLLIVAFSNISFNKTYHFNYSKKDFLYFILTGFIEASTMIIPGVSGTAILMLLGVYPIIMETFGHLFSFSYLVYNIRILIPFTMGFIIGFFLVTKCVYYLLRYEKDKTYFMILVFSFSSFLLLLIKTFMSSFSFKEFCIGIFLFVLGYSLSLVLEEKQ